MKKTINFILSLLLVLGICGGMMALIKNNVPDFPDSSAVQSSSDNKPDSFEESSSSNNTPNHSDGSDSSNSSDSGNTTPSETVKELTDPSNKSELVQEGITMASGASVYLDDDKYPSTIRFTFNVSATVKSEVENDENKTLAFFCAPLDFFEAVNTESYTYIDWVTAFKEANKNPMYTEIDSSDLFVDGDNFSARFRIQNIPYTATNRKLVCMLVLATKTGDETTYRYNGYADGVNYRNNARSLAYVSSAALNAHALGLETFEESQLANLKSYVNRSVDYANGLAEATDDNSTYTYKVQALMHDNLKIGDRFTITTIITPDVDVPVWYRSTNQDVATVDDNGKVTIVGKGTTVISVYVAGQVKGVTVTSE